MICLLLPLPVQHQLRLRHQHLLPPRDPAESQSAPTVTITIATTSLRPRWALRSSLKLVTLRGWFITDTPITSGQLELMARATVEIARRRCGSVQRKLRRSGAGSTLEHSSMRGRKRRLPYQRLRIKSMRHLPQTRFGSLALVQWK